MSQSHAKQNNILIVDDTPENLSVLTQMLTEQGYQVRPALNGQIALKAVQRALPDLILLDILMPGMTGYDVCRRLKADKRTRDIPVLFISALDETMDKVKAFGVGGVDYITKPFQAEEVLARIQTHIALRNMQRRLQSQNIRLQQEIAERKRAEEQIKASLKEREILLHELHHRTETSMNVICLMLKLQSSSIFDEQLLQIFKDLDTRIRVMALVHHNLYQAEDLSRIDLKEYFHDLALLLYKNYKVDADKISIKSRLESAFVSMDTAILCGLLLNELLSNCLKHAFPEGKTGEIRLMLHIIETGEIELRVGDNGVGLPKRFDSKRGGLLGLQLVRSIEESQLKGIVTLNRELKQGTEWIIRFKEPAPKKKVEIDPLKQFQSQEN
jgi:two-component sensor histidine kinase/CheY-like chemotaxis protein